MQHTISYYETLYAQLVLRKGVPLYPGQKLFIRTSPKTYHFAQVLAHQAYKSGCGYVFIDMMDYELQRTRLDNQNLEQLSYVPHFLTSMQHQQLAEDWAYIRIDNTEDRLELEGVDTEKLAHMQRNLRTASKTFTTSMMRHEHPWCVICAPGPVWAKQILGPKATTENLFDLLIPILRLDEPDPQKAWDDHAKFLLGLSTTLTEKRLRSLHITDSTTDTDLTLELSRDTVWIGGPKQLPSGTYYFPNIPTEEVFTVPQRLSVTGTIATTKPVTIFGSQVDGCRFTFSDGKVTSWSAQEGQVILEKFFETDEGASYMGEIALVDKHSPIAQSNQIFNSILYDENAACHFALGAGYPACFTTGKESTTDEQLHTIGCNTSALHTDFMFGSPTTRIEGITQNNERILIMENGSVHHDLL
ncbi:MAG: aminopeptidase [Spirochaetota bacterium]